MAPSRVARAYRNCWFLIITSSFALQKLVGISELHKKNIVMVKLVAVYREDEDYQYETRQLPVNVDKHLTLVLQLDDPLRSGYRNSHTKTDLRTFIKNYNMLTVEKVKQACMITERDLSTCLSHIVPCVGCRRSVEQMYSQLAEHTHDALEPLQVTTSKIMFIKRNISTNPTALYKLFYHDVFHMYSQIENLLKNKKNKRCYIHSLEMQKPRLGRSMMQSGSGLSGSNSSSLPPSQGTSIPYSSTSWMDIWNDLSNECKEEVVVLDCEGILDLMEDYLKRHRFCKDCKSKVARAFGILVDEINPSKESGYCQALYAGLRFCGPKSEKDFSKPEDDDDDSGDYEDSDDEELDDEQDDEYEDGEEDDSNHDYSDCCDNPESPCCEEHDGRKLDDLDDLALTQTRHIHVCCETNYIAHLMTRAEAEISGGNRPERHAKTVDVAQEEVLTCISLYLYERLHKLWRNVKAESQTWRILFYVSVETMRKEFEVFVEEKAGMGKLEALCEELEEEERKIEERQEKKRQKKKRQKKRKEAKKLEEAEVLSCHVATERAVNQKACPKSEQKQETKSVKQCKANKKQTRNHDSAKNGNRSTAVDSTIGDSTKQFCPILTVNHTHDLGYSSGCCESTANSQEGSELTCSDGFCDHNGCKSCEVSLLPPVTDSSCNGCQASKDKGKKNLGSRCGSFKQCHFHSKLLEMLGEDQDGSHLDQRTHSTGYPGSLDKGCEKDHSSDDEGLTAEELAEFKLNLSRMREQRIVLREKIRKDFEQLCGKSNKGLKNGLLNGNHGDGSKLKGGD